MRLIPRLALLLLCTTFVYACDSGDTGPSTPNPPPPDSIIAGVNLNQLFADPTGAERTAVREDWALRDAQLPSRYAFTLEASLIASDGAELNVYAGRDAQTGAVLFYGLARLPIRLPGDVAVRPLLLVLPDADDGVSDLFLTEGALPLFSSRQEDFVYGLVAFRGETLVAGGSPFTSSSSPSAYDFDADDAIAFADFVRGAELLADANRVGAIGVGRGGGVALLAAHRSSLFDIVIDLAGPANFFVESFQAKTRAVLSGGSGGDFPAIQALASDILLPLRDSTLSIAEARLALLRRSPSHFVAPPPFLFVAHGFLDFTVPIDHSRSIGSISGTEQGLFLEVETADHRSIVTEQNVLSLTNSFLTEHLDAP